jgi:hypothetical protein
MNRRLWLGTVRDGTLLWAIIRAKAPRMLDGRMQERMTPPPDQSRLFWRELLGGWLKNWQRVANGEAGMAEFPGD